MASPNAFTDFSPPSTLRVLVGGGGPTGLIFTYLLVDYFSKVGELLDIVVYEGRWKNSSYGRIYWRNENDQPPNVRRSQVVTLQDDILKDLPISLREHIFENFNETVWRNSKNIPIQEVEDRLLEAIQDVSRSQTVKVTLLPENLTPQTLLSYEQSENRCFHAIVAADGSESFIRRHYEIGLERGDTDYALGVAYCIPSGEPVPLSQEMNVAITLSQTRFLVNSYHSQRGFLNVRLSETEFWKAPRFRCALANVSSDLRETILCGLKLFNIPERYVLSVVRISINLACCKNPAYKLTSLQSKPWAFLIGDAAMRVHFWPGRGLNSGMKSAIQLARTFVKAKPRCSRAGILQEAELLNFPSFMQGLITREQKLRSYAIGGMKMDGFIAELDKPTFNKEAPFAELMINRIEENWRRNYTFTFRNPLWRDDREFTMSKPFMIMYVSNEWPTREQAGAEFGHLLPDPLQPCQCQFFVLAKER